MYVLMLSSYPRNLTFLLSSISVSLPSTAETNEKSRALLKTKADEYLNRAETIRLRIHVDTHKPQPDRSADVSGFSKHHSTAQSVVLDVSMIHMLPVRDSAIDHSVTDARHESVDTSYRKRSSARNRRLMRMLRKTMQRRTNST